MSMHRSEARPGMRKPGTESSRQPPGDSRPLELGVPVLRACAKVACPQPDMAQASSRGCLGLSSKTLFLPQLYMPLEAS